MPDIVSRIKIEAQGADQAAREILKLKRAYEEAGAAAKGMSPASVGSGDPFAKAVAQNSGVMAGGQSPADVAARETRNRQYQEGVRSREEANNSFNRTLREAPERVSGAFGTAEALSRGQGGAALGTAAGSLGGLVGGGLGAALLAVAAGAMGIQRMSEEAFGRLEETFATGMSQRMGINAFELDRERIGFARMGVPQQMIQQFFQTAGQSGVDFNRGSTQAAVNAAMFGSSVLGMNPASSAALIGTLNRANVNASNIMGFGLMGQAQQAFGRPNMSMFVSALTDAVESATTRGIEMSTQNTLEASNMIAGLAQFGGMSPQGAATFAGQLRGRGIEAAQLSRPEDIIALQAMRKPGMSITDTMLEMEQHPERVNQEVFKFLSSQAGNDTNYLRLRVQSYLGSGTTMSDVDRFIRTEGKMTGNVDIDRANTGGTATAEELAPDKETLKAIQVFMVRQNQFLAEANDAMLGLTTGLGAKMINLFGKEYPFNPMGMTKEGFDPRLASAQAAAHAGVAALDSVTAQDLSISHAVIESAEFEDLSKGNRRMISALLTRPDSGTSMAAAAELRQNPEVARYLQQTFTQFGGAPNQHLAELMATSGQYLGTGMGSWGEIGQALIESAIEGEATRLRQENPDEYRTMNRARNAATRALTYGPGGINEELQALGIFNGYGLSSDITVQQLDSVISLLREALGIDAVNTDGGVSGVREP